MAIRFAFTLFYVISLYGPSSVILIHVEDSNASSHKVSVDYETIADSEEIPEPENDHREIDPKAKMSVVNFGHSFNMHVSICFSIYEFVFFSLKF